MKINLEGMLMPLSGNIPILLKLDGKVYLPLFSDLDKLTNYIKYLPQIKKIVNIDEFMSDISRYKAMIDFSLIVDPYVNEKGNTVFNLVLE